MSLHRTARIVLRSSHQNFKMVRGCGGKDDGDAGREKLHTPVPDVNCQRWVLPLRYAWASLAAPHSAALFPFLSPSKPFRWFIQNPLSSRMSWSCESYSHFNISLVTHIHKKASAISPGLSNLNSLDSLSSKKSVFIFSNAFYLSSDWGDFLAAKKSKHQFPGLLFHREVW